MSSFWSRKTFCVISGASRGFGASMAITFAKHFATNSAIILLAKNADQLALTKTKIESLRTDLKVFLWAVDLCTIDGDDLNKYFKDLFAQNEECCPSKFSQCLIIHNAGSVGNISVSFAELSNKTEINDHLSLNLTSMILLNAIFFSFFTKSVTAHRYAVQISSLAGLKPIKYLGLYCGAKAARGMYFKVLSEEEGENMRVLTYAPGVLDTNMFRDILNNCEHPESATMFQDLEKSILLTCDESSRKLVKLLGHDLFESGVHIDYYDIDEDGLMNSQQPESAHYTADA